MEVVQVVEGQIYRLKERGSDVAAPPPPPEGSDPAEDAYRCWMRQRAERASLHLRPHHPLDDK